MTHLTTAQLKALVDGPFITIPLSQQLELDLRLPPEYEAFLEGMRTNSTHTPTYESNQLREFHLRTQQEK